MKEHPIPFSGPMVLAILGDCKTQTRRVISPLPTTPELDHAMWTTPDGEAWEWVYRLVDGKFHIHHGATRRCPYGKPGALLWVRESFRVVETKGRCLLMAKVQYKADGSISGWILVPESHWNKPTTEPRNSFLSGRFMPRWASRTTLKAADVRVERVQDISEADAQAEGVDLMHLDHLGQTWKTYRRGFEALWDSINAKRGYGWDVNPWVWVVEFAVHGE